MEYGSLLKVKNEVSLFSILLLSVIFICSIILDYIGMGFVGFLFLILFCLFSFRLYIKNKNEVHYIMIKKEELGDTLYLFNTSKKEILSDLIKNYDFHKPINKAFEIKHRSSSKNFALYMNTTTSSIHQYLIQNKVPLKKRNLKLSFWSLIDAITTL